MNTVTKISSLALLVAFLVVLAAPAEAKDAARDKKIDAMTAKAVKYLSSRQADDGSFVGEMGPGVTGVITMGLLEAGVKTSTPVVAKALKYLKGFTQKDGGIYKKDSFTKSYETSIALQVFALANKDGQYDALIKNAKDYITGAQWGADGKVKKSENYFGGAGYGKHQRPDLSNTAFLLDALKAAGTKADDPAMKRALVFVSRCQNLESEHNTTPWATKINDGSFYYTPGETKPDEGKLTENGGLRGYGSMTYAGLKSMVYAGLSAKDKRVKAAFEWATKNYDLTTNPGMGPEGLFYYYMTLAKALSAMEADKIVDADGKKHIWRDDMVNQLEKQQRKDGSWINTGSDRWLEGEPLLVTGYALIALGYCK